MKNILIVLGGESTEHDISIISGLQVVENLDKTKYNVSIVFIDKKGDFYLGNKNLKAEDYKQIDVKKLKKVCIVPNDNHLYVKTLFGYKKRTKIHCVLPILHGKNGEDGTMQSLFELAKIPYASCSVVGSSIGMDKVISKQVFSANNVDILPYYWFTKNDYIQNKQQILFNKEFEFPKIVKPSCLGSSIGINVCNNVEELEKAIEIALEFDNKVLVEKALTNFKEINIACMKDGERIVFSDIEQPRNWKKFLDFNEKYLSSPTKLDLKKKIKISKKNLEYIQKNSVRIYRNCELNCIVRFDYMIDKTTNKIFLNEINTIPGSLANYLWKNCGYNFSLLLDKIIEQAEYEFNKKASLKTYYISDVLNIDFSSKKLKK